MEKNHYLTMQIRPETAADYAAIANVHIRAFGDRMDEALIVVLLRQRLSYDPELSLVAEIEGQIAGHVLFTPCTIMLSGKEVRAVLLAPIGVHPDFQQQGIGGKLITTGHDIARKKGFPLSFLIGHWSYYPRFGYQTKAFGNSSIIVPVSDFLENNLETRSPLVEDIAALMALWQHEEGTVNYAIQPEAALADWLSLNPAMQAIVYLQEGAVAGYSRGNAEELQMFLAKNHEIAQSMAKMIAGENDFLKLPLHPHSASAGAFGEPTIEAWEAAMVCPLVEHAPLPADGELIGRPIWPNAFDLA